MDATARDDEGPDWPLDEGPPPDGRLHGNATRPDVVARIVALRREGLTYAQVMERLGVDDNTVWRYSARAGLVTPRLCSVCGKAIPGRRVAADVAPRCAGCRQEARRKAGAGATVARRRE